MDLEKDGEKLVEARENIDIDDTYFGIVFLGQHDIANPKRAYP